MRCGTATAATAVFIPYRVATRGVRRLPIPKPAIEAIPEANTATIPTAKMNIDVSCYAVFFCNTVTVHYPFD
jgi:hypothetical protein